MSYKLLADVIVVIHFLWIIFMIAGFVLTAAAFRWRKLFDWFWLRTIHLAGIVFVAMIGVLGTYCPLTVWESALRERNDPSAAHAGSFIVHWIERVVYPNMSPLAVTLPVIAAAVVTLIIYVIRPPLQLAGILRKHR
ncbi:MAG: DUF2784 domain-containing protein [Candidatus Zixiibacteriota bacterium]|nr:MAG: DUF2784 domain-containing protein [candidate division Zixibacteria bacterium]